MIRINNTSQPIEHFPAGEQRLTLTVQPGTAHTVEWLYEREDELVTLLYLCHHIKTKGGILSILNIPYLPNARMDRTQTTDDVFTLKHFCQLINTLGFATIYVNNPHSDVALALLNNAEDAYLTNGQRLHNNAIICHLITRLNLNPAQDILFYPDQGCAKKYEGVIPFPYLIGHKHRNRQTGKIESYDTLGPLPQPPFNALIVDDICSYGTTFFHAATKLKTLGADRIWLYVTHCENTILKGKLISSGLTEKIFTTRSIFTAPCPQSIEILENISMKEQTP
ncbi:MAG: ribose-phosphate pyrophosphokinase [Peptococcaceae bacterium]|nr:ribose-phosphate pyrophosphokinase [Peptococcaceae bacterium]